MAVKKKNLCNAVKHDGTRCTQPVKETGLRCRYHNKGPDKVIVSAEQFEPQKPGSKPRSVENTPEENVDTPDTLARLEELKKMAVEDMAREYLAKQIVISDELYRFHKDARPKGLLYDRYLDSYTRHGKMIREVLELYAKITGVFSDEEVGDDPVMQLMKMVMEDKQAGESK